VTAIACAAVALAAPAIAEAAGGNPVPASTVLASAKLYVNPNSPASKQSNDWAKSRPADAALMRYIAAQPTATWLGDWNSDIKDAVSDVMRDAGKSGSLPVLVAYDIPNRDCGSYSAGGARDEHAYDSWIHGFAAGLGGRHAIVILEPDAIAGSDCLSAAARDSRFTMLRNAVQTLQSSGALVYLDAGNAHWVSAGVMADRLRKAGIDQASGFSLNVSNFFSTSDNTAFGTQLSQKLGGKHFVIDTSRNGSATSNGQWCNPNGQSLGTAPTTRTGNSLIDALLWVKQPGESDGTCNGGPTAGKWWADYALGLAQRGAPAMLASR
jgi:endoglucanase